MLLLLALVVLILAVAGGIAVHPLILLLALVALVLAFAHTRGGAAV
jgi:hypothetical protein